MAKIAAVIDEREVQVKIIIDNLIEDVKDLEKEKESINAIYQAKFEQLKANLDDRLFSIDTKIKNATRDIRVLADQIELKETATQLKFEGLSGTVIIKKPKDEVDCEKDKMLEWALENNVLEFVKSKETKDFAWAEFKKSLVVDGERILNNETGEIIEIKGLFIKHKQEELQIK